MLWHAFDISVHKLMIWSLKKMRWTFSLKSIEKLNLRIDFTSNLIFVVVRTSGCKMCVLLELFFFFCSTLTKAIMILFVFLLLKWVMTSFCEYKLFSVVVFLLSTRFNNRSDLITKFFLSSNENRFKNHVYTIFSIEGRKGSQFNNIMK